MNVGRKITKMPHSRSGKKGGHEDHIADREYNYLLNLAHKPIPITQVLRIPDAKAAVGQKWDK